MTPIELPAPVRGATHARLESVFIGLEDCIIYCRGTMGTMDGETFVPDSYMKPFYVDFTGDDYETRFSAMEDPGLIMALIVRNWGYDA
jgi:hypothetical protein